MKDLEEIGCEGEDWIYLNYWVLGLLPSSGILENRKHDVSKLDLFLSSGEQIQFPKRRVFYLLENRTMEKVQKLSNSECFAPSSEPFRIYLDVSGSG
jgi:hypothetical protein